MLLAAQSDGLPITSQPISTIYLENNSSTHYHAVRDSLTILWSLLRFSISSLSCALLDLALFTCLSGLVFAHISNGVALAVIVARLGSGATNYLLNRHLVFGRAHRSTAIKYLTLFIAQMTASALLTTILAATLLPALVAKILVDTVLFFISYTIQQRLIFTERSHAGR